MSCTTTDCGFSCNQTPLQINRTSDIPDLSGVAIQQTRGYGNATARLVCLTPGPMTVSKPTDGSSGIHIEEQIQNTFTLYGVSYTLQYLRLFTGQHKIFPWADVSDQCGNLKQSGAYTTAPLEMYCYFKDPTTGRILCLVLPIGIKAGAATNASKYFKALNQTPTSSTPSLLSLFQDLPVVTTNSKSNVKNTMLYYYGQDVRTYNTTANCDSSSLRYPVQYLVIMNDINGTKKFGTTITPDDAAAFIGVLQKIGITPYLILNTQINGTNVGIKSGDIPKIRFFAEGTLYIANSSSQFSTLDTTSLKCYPVDPKKNIKNKELYLDEKGRPTNINCPTKEFTSFVGNNGKYYCCDGKVTDTNTCSNTDENRFCGLNTDKDPSGNTISTCDETTNRLLNIQPPTSNFLTSAAGIETILALGIGLIFGIGFLIFTRNRTFTDTSAAATAVASAAANGAAGAASIAVTPVIKAALEASKTNVSYPGWWWAVIILLVLFVLAFTATIVLVLFNLGLLDKK